ncbi:UNVERIFIED_CONTAM: hypothetical protein ABID98_004390 [Brevibacillus sp. OAP136]
MPDSNALVTYKETLQVVEKLLELERQYRNPPRQEETKAVLGLRGGAAVMMVAGFENFLRQVVEEHLSELTLLPLKVNFNRLPDKIKTTSVFLSLENAMKGPKYETPIPKIDRLAIIEQASKNFIAGLIDPSAFSSTGGNPNSKTVNSMFNNLGIEDVFSKIRAKFITKWGKPEAHTFIPDKLNEIVNHRHVVAHTANALNLGRSQLKEAVKFLKILATVLDSELKNHIRTIITTA